jgi:beta-carotene hydroxylase
MSGLLKYKADYRTLAFLATYYSMFLGCWFFLPFEWYYILPALVLLGSINFMVAITIHNTVHCPIFYNKTLNKINFILLSIAFGSPATGYVPGHNLSHHKHLQTAKDNARTGKMNFKWNFLNQFLFFFVMIPGIVKTESKFVKEIGPTKPKWRRQYRTEVAFVWLWRITWLVINWKLFLVFLLLPNIYAVWGIFGTNFWQHDGCDENHPFNHSRTFKNKLFNFWVCNNGYHGAHHMKPALHWSLYPEYHKREITPYIHPNLEKNTLIAFCWQQYIWPGKRLDYLGNQVVANASQKDEDWVMETKSGKLEMEAADLGAEVN